MNKEGFARLAFEAHYNADHREGGWEAWPDSADGDEGRAWLAVGALIEELTGRAVRDASRADEPEPTKVVIVTEADNYQRRYQADDWNGDTSGLDVLRDDKVIASYPGEHTWLSARLDGTEADDTQAKALGIARQALTRTLGVLSSRDQDHVETRDAASDMIGTALSTLADLGYE